MPLGAGLTEGRGAAHAKSSTRRVEVHDYPLTGDLGSSSEFSLRRLTLDMTPPRFA